LIAAVAGAVLLGAVVFDLGIGTGGGGDGGPGNQPGGKPGGQAAPQVQTRVSVGRVTGELRKPSRKRLPKRIGGVVDGWLDAAYVGGDYPRTDFSGAWPGFTAGARTAARRDARLMSNSDIGGGIDAVTPVSRSVRVDVLAVKRKAVGVTAHVKLKFDTTGDPDTRVKVAGRLYLTKRDESWQVFGFDVTKERI
jgi:hypothetical protein